MSTVELKNRLKEKIEELSEDQLLYELLNIIELDEMNTAEVIKIPEEHKARLDISLEQIKSGETLPHTRVMKELKDGLI